MSTTRDIAARDACLDLVRATERLSSEFTDLFKSRGLTPAHYNVLRILRGAGEEGLPTLEVGERMIEKTPGVTRLLDRLEEKGWVRRDRSRKDRRLVLCRVTESGLAVLGELDEPIAESDRACVRELTRAEQRQLIALASRIAP